MAVQASPWLKALALAFSGGLFALAIAHACDTGSARQEEPPDKAEPSAAEPSAAEPSTADPPAAAVEVAAPSGEAAAVADPVAAPPTADPAAPESPAKEATPASNGDRRGTGKRGAGKNRRNGKKDVFLPGSKSGIFIDREPQPVPNAPQQQANVPQG